MYLSLSLSFFSLHKRTFTAGEKTNAAKSLSNVRVQIYEYRKRKRNEKLNGMKRKRFHLNNKPTNILDSLRSGGDIALYVYKMAFYNREDAGRKTTDGAVVTAASMKYHSLSHLFGLSCQLYGECATQRHF